jgi:two-component system sensor kinase FixL
VALRQLQHDAEVASFLFEHARDIILVIDADDGRIVDANRAAEQAYGYARSELLSLSVFDLRRDAVDDVIAQMRRAQEAGVLFETVHRRSDGTTFPVEISSRGETLGGRSYLFSILRDISDRKRLEHERESLLATTQRALAQRDDFLMLASHELRTPLNNVSMQLQRLLRLIERATPLEQLHAVAEAGLAECSRLGALIESLLEAQAEQDELVLELGDVSLTELVHDVVARLRPRADQAGSALVSDLVPVRGYWDRARLEQVLVSLLGNAIKFGRGKPIRIQVRTDGPHVHLEVVDQGTGIAPEDHDRIFKKFERAIPSHHGGLGLGLYLARRIVEAHAGTLAVESRIGEGSTFRVTLSRRV